MSKPVTPEEFREVMGRFATGVTIVTIEDEDGKPYGLTVNSFTSVSMHPPLVLVCLDNQLSGLANFKESGRFGVNILAEDQADLSDYFAQPGTDRSQGHYVKGETGATTFGWGPGQNGMPDCQPVSRRGSHYCPG